jgi:pilus assembly protein CpaE
MTMETFVACNDQTVSFALRAALSRLGVSCSGANVVSHEKIGEVAAHATSNRPIVVFLGSQAFSNGEIPLLRRLCTLGADRVKVVAVGMTSNADVILQTVRCGAIDYLDVSGAFESALGDLLNRLRKDTKGEASLGRLITIIAPVGGCGASLIATNLAAALARDHGPCALLDLQLRGGVLASILKITPPYNFASLADKADQLDCAMFEQSLVKHSSGIRLLASPEPFSPIRPLGAGVIHKVFALARNMFSNVVADFDSNAEPELLRELAESDQLILPLRPDFVSLYRTKRCLDHLTKSGIRRDMITVVANRTGQPKEIPIARVEEVLGVAIAHQIPDDPGTVNSSLVMGIPLVESSPGSKAALAMVRLGQAIVHPQVVQEAVKSRGFFLRRAVGLLGALPG